MIVALAAGAAGAFATGREDVSDALPGVAIAISLVPPLSVVGICLAAGEPRSPLGALVLFFTNFLAIIISGMVIFAMMGYGGVAQNLQGRPARQWTAFVIAVATLIILVPLTLTGIRVGQNEVMQRRVGQALDKWLAGTEFDTYSIVADGSKVDVIIAGPGDAPPLDTLQQDLESEVGEVVVNIKVVPETNLKVESLPIAVEKRGGKTMPRVTHFAIDSDEPERAIRFYGGIFGWKFEKWKGPMDYWQVTTGPDEEPGINGGMGKRSPEGLSFNAYRCTVEVPDVEEYSARVKGGRRPGPHGEVAHPRRGMVRRLRRHRGQQLRHAAAGRIGRLAGRQVGLAEAFALRQHQVQVAGGVQHHGDVAGAAFQYVPPGLPVLGDEVEVEPGRVDTAHVGGAEEADHGPADVFLVPGDLLGHHVRQGRVRGLLAGDAPYLQGGELTLHPDGVEVVVARGRARRRTAAGRRSPARREECR